MLELSWELLINSLESFLYLIFFEDKLEHKTLFSKTTTWILKISFLLLDTFRTSVFNHIKIPYEFNYIISFFCILLFTILFYKSKLAEDILYSCIFCGFLLFSETMLYVSLTMLFHISISEITYQGSFRLCSTLLYVILVTILICFSHLVKKRTLLVSPLNNIIFVIICTIGFFFGEYIASICLTITPPLLEKVILISIIYNLLFLTLLIYMYFSSLLVTENQHLQLERHQMIQEENYYKSLLSTTDSLRNFKHDIKHHLSMIKILSEEENYHELNTYIDKYIGSINDIHTLITTGNTAIDCTLSANISEAKRHNISVNYMISLPDNFNLDPIQTSSLLGNLWSNAITACNLKKENKYINFSIKPIHQMVLICIENSFNGHVKKDSFGNYISTKKTPFSGIGIKRIKKIVETNHGIIDITNTESYFSVNILFPLEELSI